MAAAGIVVAVIWWLRVDAPSVTEELFGPVASVIRVRGYEEALHVANDTEFGLSAGIAAQESEPVKRMDSLSRRLSAAIVTGSALPAMAMAAPGTGGAGGRGATPIAAGLPPITFVINAAPGQSEEAIAEMVARKLRELGIAAPGAGSPSFGDRPDWE